MWLFARRYSAAGNWVGGEGAALHHRERRARRAGLAIALRSRGDGHRLLDRALGEATKQDVHEPALQAAHRPSTRLPFCAFLRIIGLRARLAPALAEGHQVDHAIEL